MREYVSEELRVLLARRQLTASRVARELGWQQMYLSRRMTGKTPFDVDDLEALARFLEVDVRTLFPSQGGPGALSLKPHYSTATHRGLLSCISAARYKDPLPPYEIPTLDSNLIEAA